MRQAGADALAGAREVCVAPACVRRFPLSRRKKQLENRGFV
jgi:hypothetical protein